METKVLASLLQFIFLCFISVAFELQGSLDNNDKAPRPEIQKEYSSE